MKRSKAAQSCIHGGKPDVGMTSKILERMLARPVSSPSQYGLEVDSASICGRKPSSESMNLMDFSLLRTPTWKCTPWIGESSRRPSDLVEQSAVRSPGLRLMESHDANG